MLNFIFNLLSGAFPFCLTVLVGGYFTYKTKLYQVRNFKNSVKVLSDDNGQGISGFSAMCNSLAAALGTGNIVGVAAAVSLGGAGAVFWMWISAFLGMVIKAGEIALGVFFREKHNENFVGGPQIYIKNTMPKKLKIMAYIYSIFGIFAAFFGGNMAQINSALCNVLKSDFFRLLVGGFSAVIVCFVICGGQQKIARFLTKILPAMAVLYMFLCFGVIFKNYSEIPSVFKSIFIGAFSPKAVTGGAVGSIFTAISVGASKGIFSNEAGVGTAAVAHSAVENAKPFRQGLYGIFEVFIDTILLCTLTALTILTSGVIIDYNNVASFGLTLAALETVYGNASAYALGGMLWLFGISSVIGWATYGISFCRFLCENWGEKIFSWSYPLFCLVGVLLPNGFIWQMAELFNGFLVIINLFTMLYLSKTVVGILKGNKNDKKSNFTASKLLKRK